MNLLATLSHQTTVRLAEVGSLLILIAGIWLAIAELRDDRWRKLRRVVAGVLLAGAGLLLIVALHWGQLG